MAYGGRFLYYAVSDGENWHHETVDDAPWVGAGGASLVLDPAGHPHLAYCDGENLAIKYAYRDDDGWQVESVSGAMKAQAESQGAGGFGSCAASLALDREGEPHIAFFGKLPGYNLWYAHREAEGWRAEVVDFTQNSGMEPSIALDSQDHPHIAYYTGYPSYKLWYAYWEDGWHRQLLRDLPGHDGDVGQYPSLALDAQDHFHISYYDATEGNLEYMAGSPRAWDIEIVDADGDAGQSTSLVLDNAGQPHVSYSAASPVPAVKYAYRDALGWHVDTVADQVEVSGDTALALDLAGRPFVGFESRGDDTLDVLQVASQHSAGWWITTVVDRSGEAGQDSSLVLDAAGYPHISYHAADYGGVLARCGWSTPGAIPRDGVGKRLIPGGIPGGAGEARWRSTQMDGHTSATCTISQSPSVTPIATGTAGTSRQSILRRGTSLRPPSRSTRWATLMSPTSQTAFGTPIATKGGGTSIPSTLPVIRVRALTGHRRDESAAHKLSRVRHAEAFCGATLRLPGRRRLAPRDDRRRRRRRRTQLFGIGRGRAPPHCLLRGLPVSPSALRLPRHNYLVHREGLAGR